MFVNIDIVLSWNRYGAVPALTSVTTAYSSPAKYVLNILNCLFNHNWAFLTFLNHFSLLRILAAPVAAPLVASYGGYGLGSLAYGNLGYPAYGKYY